MHYKTAVLAAGKKVHYLGLLRGIIIDVAVNIHRNLLDENWGYMVFFGGGTSVSPLPHRR
jgi:hypothetical protein